LKKIVTVLQLNTLVLKLEPFHSISFDNTTSELIVLYE